LCPGDEGSIELAEPVDPEGRYWVAVNCWFTCRACGHDSPMNQLDLDGSIACLNCGISQKFEPVRWTQVVRAAHQVGDLGGADPEGRTRNPAISIAAFNPMRGVGVDSQYFDFEPEPEHLPDTGVQPHRLRVRAALGHPLSAEREPVEIRRLGAGSVTVYCSRARTEATYAFPENAPRAFPGLLAVIGEEHVAGRRQAQLHGASAVSVNCPTCSAPLHVTGHDTIVTCQYCQTTAILPSGVLRALGHKTPRAQVWWMLFGGPSELRRELEAYVRREAARKAEYDREVAAWEVEHGKARAARKAKRRDPLAQKRLDESIEALEAGLRDSSRENSPMTMVIILLVVAAVGLLGFVAVSH
jgi:uncharacterized Zn finger protein (UPF0148 family)